MTHEEEPRNFIDDRDGSDLCELCNDFPCRCTESELDDYDDFGEGCYNCGGRHWIVVCIDDMCRGAGECMHGDGEAPCPVCNKDGSREDSHL